MIPAGYMYKKVVERPNWLTGAPQVIDILSVSGCIAEVFANYTDRWRHNGAWLFDTAGIMREIAYAGSVDLSTLKLFHYEMHEQAFVEATSSWVPVELKHFPMRVVPPDRKTLMGYDVVTYWQDNAAECSPLSCNGLASELPVNSHCLLDSFEAAKEALERGAFDKSEPGPFRILAVYTVKS